MSEKQINDIAAKIEARDDLDGDLHWPEDYPHENGKYFCRCVHCNASFFGHKRRVCCKRCHIKHLESRNEALAAEVKRLTKENALLREGLERTSLRISTMRKLTKKEYAYVSEPFKEILAKLKGK